MLGPPFKLLQTFGLLEMAVWLCSAEQSHTGDYLTDVLVIKSHQTSYIITGFTVRVHTQFLRMLEQSLPKLLVVLDHLILGMLVVVSLLLILSVLGSNCIQSQIDSSALGQTCGGQRYDQSSLCCCGGGCSCNQEHLRYDIV